MKTIRFAQLSDAPALLSIYAHYVKNSVITFEYDVPSLEEFEGRMMKIQREYPYLVCELDQKIIGYAYAHRHMERAAGTAPPDWKGTVYGTFGGIKAAGSADGDFLYHAAQ